MSPSHLNSTQRFSKPLDESVDYAIAAQAFHRFHPQQEQAQSEFTRILKPGGWLVLLWNSRRLDSIFA